MVPGDVDVEGALHLHEGGVRLPLLEEEGRLLVEGAERQRHRKAVGSRSGAVALGRCTTMGRRTLGPEALGGHGRGEERRGDDGDRGGQGDEGASSSHVRPPEGVSLGTGFDAPLSPRVDARSRR